MAGGDEGIVWASRRAPHEGVIESFDAERGLGIVLDHAGTQVPFHCTAIADGSRQIDVGTAVTFLLEPGALGQMEARGIVPCA